MTKDFIINIDIVDHLDIQGALDMAIGNPVIATPNCIIIQLNRTTFEPNTHKTKKIFKKIYHNQTITIMTENDIVEYDIIAAICHSGMSPEHGHYVIYLKNGEYWICANDSYVYYPHKEVHLIQGDDVLHNYLSNFEETTPEIETFMNRIRTASMLLYIRHDIIEYRKMCERISKEHDKTILF